MRQIPLAVYQIVNFAVNFIQTPHNAVYEVDESVAHITQSISGISEKASSERDSAAEIMEKVKRQKIEIWKILFRAPSIRSTT